MSELDNNRKVNFLKNIKNTQIIITCTDDINIENVKINKFKVEEGQVFKNNTWFLSEFKYIIKAK